MSSHGHITPADESPTPTLAPVGISRELGLILKVKNTKKKLSTTLQLFSTVQEIRVITDKIAEDADSGDIEADWRCDLAYNSNYNHPTFASLFLFIFTCARSTVSQSVSQ